MILSRLGDYIELTTEINNSNIYGIDDVRGMTITKEVISTKADVSKTDLTKFLVIKPKEFIYNPRTHGKKIGLGFNDTYTPFIISWNNIGFRVKKNKTNELDPTYLFIYLNRFEWDRWATFSSWGSSTEVFTWDTMCNMQLIIPPIEIQRKYVAIYKGLKDNLKVYQSKLDDLKLVYEGYIEKLRKEMSTEEIGPYIQEVNVKNIDNIKNVLGVDSTSNFVNTKAKMNGIDLTKYSVVKEGQFAYNPSRINLGSIALRKGQECVISPMYEIFEVKDNTKLVSEYLFMWLTRKEFLRSTLFYAIGSVRDTFDFNLMEQVKIPIPSKEIQEDVVKIHNSYIKRKKILDNLKQTINGICPILIRGAIKEANDGVA